MEIVNVKNVTQKAVSAGTASRTEIVAWVNGLLTEVHIAKVEELSSGYAYCLLMDMLFGVGTVQIKKVKSEATLETDTTSNFKLLQASFKKLGIDREIPIIKITKGKFSDNLAFAQWFKVLYEINSAQDESDVMSKTFRAPGTTKAKGNTEESNLCQLMDTVSTTEMNLKKMKHLVGALETNLTTVQDKVLICTSNYNLKKVLKEKDDLLDKLKARCEEEDRKASNDPAMNAFLHQLLRLLNQPSSVPTDGKFKLIRAEAVSAATSSSVEGAGVDDRRPDLGTEQGQATNYDEDETVPVPFTGHRTEDEKNDDEDGSNDVDEAEPPVKKSKVVFSTST